MTPRQLVPLAALCFALPASGASAATCTGSVKNPNIGEANAEFSLGCDTAISNGSLTVSMNRGGSLVGKPEFDMGGSMTCSINQGMNGMGSITCTGSLPAGSHAIIDASLGPNPCSSPAFSATLSAAFGDGTTSGPQPLPPYTGCSSGGGGGGGGSDDPGPGHNFDPGGVFQGSPRGLPSKATVAQARHGLRFTIKLGVRGKVVVTIEIGRTRTVVGRFGPHRTHAGPTSLVARLSAAGARKLAGKRTRAKVHIEVMPNADEGFTTHGRRYYSLTLTG